MRRRIPAPWAAPSRRRRGKQPWSQMPDLLLLLLLVASSLSVARAFLLPPRGIPSASSSSSVTTRQQQQQQRRARIRGPGFRCQFQSAPTLLPLRSSSSGGGGAADSGEAASSQPVPEGLAKAFGKGKGKHQRAQTRKKKNKYEKFSKIEGEIDPLEAAMREAARANDPELARREEEEKRRQEERERGVVEYPSILEIDPYEPNTFGFIEAGVIQGAHGVDGQVKVRATSDVAMEAFASPGLRHIKGPKRRYPRPVQVTEARPTVDDMFLLKIEGVEDREQAAALRDFKVYIREEERPELEEDEFFVRDMINMDVVMVGAEDVSIGRVVDVITGETERQGLANDLLEVELRNEEPEDAAEAARRRLTPPPTYLVLVPFVKKIVPVVDTAGRTIHIDPPPGLLDLAYEKQERVVVRGALPSTSQYSDMSERQQEQSNARGRKRKRVAVKRPSLPCKGSSDEGEEDEGSGET